MFSKVYFVNYVNEKYIKLLFNYCKYSIFFYYFCKHLTVKYDRIVFTLSMEE